MLVDGFRSWVERRKYISVMSDEPLIQGCYLSSYRTGSGPQMRQYDGTVRVEIKDNEAIISGDLYERPPNGQKPDPSKGIPILPLDDYRFYLKTKAKAAASAGNGITLT